MKRNRELRKDGYQEFGIYRIHDGDDDTGYRVVVFYLDFKYILSHGLKDFRPGFHGFAHLRPGRNPWNPDSYWESFYVRNPKPDHWELVGSLYDLPKGAPKTRSAEVDWRSEEGQPIGKSKGKRCRGERRFRGTQDVEMRRAKKKLRERNERVAQLCLKLLARDRWMAFEFESEEAFKAWELKRAKLRIDPDYEYLKRFCLKWEDPEL